VTRPSLAYFVAERAELEMRTGAFYGGLENGALEQRIGGRYSLADAGQAHRDLEGRGTIGKLLIVSDT